MMKSILKYLLIACSFLSSLALAQEDQCAGLPEYIAKAIKHGYEHDCQCGSKLHNLKITAPAGMKLVAACSLRELGKGEMIDLSKSRATLDQSPNGLVGDLFFLARWKSLVV
jgi:hypothetical protein